MHYYLKALRNYAVFSGRASRAEYWYFISFDFVISLGFSLGGYILVFLYRLVVTIPAIAVGVRRMHDVNKSGWYILIPIYNIVLYFRDGTKGDNKYGSDPKGRQVKARIISMSAEEERRNSF